MNLASNHAVIVVRNSSHVDIKGNQVLDVRNVEAVHVDQATTTNVNRGDSSTSLATCAREEIVRFE
jgi:hypothetical protein